jgi:hypothetical protein
VEINNQVLPLNHNPKILEALSGTTYGQDKETLLQT